jgi:hypothetical protein
MRFILKETSLEIFEGHAQLITKMIRKQERTHCNSRSNNCNDPPPMTQYCPLLAPPNQTSQEVTHPGTVLAEARLTAEF